MTQAGTAGQSVWAVTTSNSRPTPGPVQRAAGPPARRRLGHHALGSPVTGWPLPSRTVRVPAPPRPRAPARSVWRRGGILPLALSDLLGGSAMSRRGSAALVSRGRLRRVGKSVTPRSLRCQPLDDSECLSWSQTGPARAGRG